MDARVLVCKALAGARRKMQEAKDVLLKVVGQENEITQLRHQLAKHNQRATAEKACLRRRTFRSYKSRGNFPAQLASCASRRGSRRVNQSRTR